MIINTGARTDTVQYYSDWLLNRFREGFVYSRNPLFQNNVTRYELTPEKVDAVVFCSKNYRPILSRLHEITDRFNTYFYYTITAYGKDIEPGVPDIETSMQTLMELAAVVGKKRIAWRYDPVLLTDKYTIERHFTTFESMCERLAPYIDRCIFSFVEMYRKLETNMPELRPVTLDQKRIIAKGLGEIAARHGVLIQTCGTDEDFSRFGILTSGCMTLDILGKANGVVFKDLKHKGARNGCHCIESRDIGAYETCPNGCRYCYANKSHEKALANFKRHNPDSPILIGEISEDDIVKEASRKSFLDRKTRDIAGQIEFKI